MNAKQILVVILPEHLEELPVKVIKGAGNRHLVLSAEQDENISVSARDERRYAFIWQQNDYLKVALDDILWIEASGSYSVFHLSGGKATTVSFHLASILKKLPQTDFMRIHRSYIVNMKHVVSLIGNSLRIGGQLLVVGREYRRKLFDRFIFIGVRRDK